MADAELETNKEVDGKDAIYVRLSEIVKERTGKNIGKTGGRILFDTAFEEFFALATKQGTLRLNGGFGSFHVREYGAGERRLPSGVTTTFGERKKIRYEEGVCVKALVANGDGNLEKAKSVRGGKKAEEEAPKAAAVKKK